MKTCMDLCLQSDDDLNIFDEEFSEQFFLNMKYLFYVPCASSTRLKVFEIIKRNWANALEL